MKFADLVVVFVVFVEGARLDLSTLIARYEVYKLERLRRSSYRQRLWWYEYGTRRARGECWREHVVAQAHCSCREQCRAGEAVEDALR